MSLSRELNVSALNDTWTFSRERIKAFISLGTRASIVEYEDGVIVVVGDFV